MRPRFFSPGASLGTAIRLPDDECHHLIHVLRLGAGAAVAVFDGAGHEWHGTVESAGRDGAVVRLDATTTPVAEPSVAVTIGVGLQKGDRMETIVREATALGVAAIVPVSTAHVALPSRARRTGAAFERWRRVAIAAAKQCGRAVVPEISGVVTMDALLPAHAGASILICVEPGVRGRGTSDGPGPRPARALALVGPEGGWTDAEVASAVRAGARLVHLGPRTLRADLAPTVLLSSLWTAWGWQ
jgi:16S rRNA (uracil1498-N3)-methyltransferase